MSLNSSYSVIRIECHLTSYNMIWNFRYFTGHSKNPDGSTQYVRGVTSASNVVDGVIKIFTVAVSSVSGYLLWYLNFFFVSVFACLLLLIMESLGHHCGCCCA